MSNIIRAGALKGSPKFRVYIAEEPGALLVRHSQASTLAKALQKAGNLATAVDWQVRIFWGGVERLIHVEHITIPEVAE